MISTYCSILTSAEDKQLFIRGKINTHLIDIRRISETLLHRNRETIEEKKPFHDAAILIDN